MNAKERNTLLETLEARFEKNRERHKGVKWADVKSRLEKGRKALETLHAMEESGGEPDVVKLGGKTGPLTFCDCSAESPSGRRSLCFDQAALQSRKEHKPRGSALQLAADIGIEILSESDYRALQELGEFDRKTSSWVATPHDVRSLGGALFCDRRYDKVFLYHNGAESYYASRGFRGKLEL